MRPYRYVLTALVIAGFAANDASLAQQRTSGKSYLKQVGSIKFVRQRVPPRRVLGASGPDLAIQAVLKPAVTSCVAPSTLQVDFDVRILNIGDAPATLMQSSWAAWLRMRDANWYVFSPFDLDEYVGPPPPSIDPGTFATFHISRRVKQDASGGWGVAVTADPYNWILESDKNNNSLGTGSQQSVCQ